MLNINNPSLILKRLVLYFFFYMILEGVLRKWIFPSLSTQIYFVKDIFLIIIYLIALKYDLMFKLKYSKSFIVFIIVISLFGFIGYDLSKNGIISYILGLRSYWLFLPLFLIIVHLYNKNDLIKLIKLNLYLILPYFLLIYLQSYLPVTSFLNSGFDGTLLSPERPSAFFTYTTQNIYYFLFLFFSLCSFILDKKELPAKDLIYLSILNFLLISVMILLKSRSVYFYVFTTIFYSTFFLILSNLDIKLKLKKIFLILIISYASFIITSEYIFIEKYNYSTNRMNTDVAEEYNFVKDYKNKKLTFIDSLLKDKIIKKSSSVSDRIVSDRIDSDRIDSDRIDSDRIVSDRIVSDTTIYDFCIKYSTLCRIINMLYIYPAISDSSLFGEGIGAGTKTVVIFNKIKRSFYLGELDNKRTIMELGYIVGSFLVTIKMLTAIILNFIVLFKYRDKHKLIYLPIVFFICTQLLIGTVSYTSSFISFIFWFSLGLFFISFKREDRNL